MLFPDFAYKLVLLVDPELMSYCGSYDYPNVGLECMKTPRKRIQLKKRWKKFELKVT